MEIQRPGWIKLANQVDICSLIISGCQKIINIIWMGTNRILLIQKQQLGCWSDPWNMTICLLLQMRMSECQRGKSEVSACLHVRHASGLCRGAFFRHQRVNCCWILEHPCYAGSISSRPCKVHLYFIQFRLDPVMMICDMVLSDWVSTPDGEWNFLQHVYSSRQVYKGYYNWDALILSDWTL